jgi:hypothetical protein
MTDASSPPDIDTLRAFVRDELDEASTDDVYHWMVRCTDPRLPNLMESLQIEWEQEQADAELSEPGQRVGEHFLSLWREGKGRVDAAHRISETESTFEYAFRREDEGRPEEGLELVEYDDQRPDYRKMGIRLVVGAPRRRVVGVLWTDREDPELFWDETFSPETGVEYVDENEFPPYRFDHQDGRVTFWYVAADTPDVLDPLPESSESFADWLNTSVTSDSIVVRAARLTSRYLSDLYE